MRRATNNIQQSKIILGERLSPNQFLLSEAILFVTQTIVFLIVAVVMSGMLTQEQALLDFVTAKVNKTTMTEFFVTLGALAATLGVLFAISQGAEQSSSEFLQRISEEAMLDAPRVIYAVGSSITAAAIASGIFKMNNPAIQAPHHIWWFFMAFILASFFFTAGSGLSYWLKRHTHIRKATNKAPNTKSAP